MNEDWDLPEGQTQYSEVDELKARLAEVTAERDRLLDAVEAWDEAEDHHRTYLRWPVDEDASHVADTYREKRRALVTIAAEIRKGMQG